jgi:hypothetical protein
MLTLPTGSPKTPKQVRDVAVSVSLSADTAADQADGAIAHSAPVRPFRELGLALSEPLQGPVAQLVRAHA